MTPVEELALAVQAAVLDRLERQLAAVEAAVVRVVEGELAQEASAESGTSSRVVSERAGERARGDVGGAASLRGASERDASERDASVRDASERDASVRDASVRDASVGGAGERRVSLADSPRSFVGSATHEESASAIEAARGSGSRRELESREPFESAGEWTTVFEAEAPTFAPEPSPRELVTPSPTRSSDRWSARLEPRGQPTPEAATIEASAPELTPPTRPALEQARDRWSRAVRPSGRERIAEVRAGLDDASRRATTTTTTRASLRDESSSHESTSQGQTRASELSLPAPLRLPIADAVGVEHERPTPLVLHRELPARPEPFASADPLASPEPMRPTAFAAARFEALGEPRRGLDRTRAFDRQPTTSRRDLAPIPELTLEDEFDELSRLEERMADVLERVLLEIGVEP